MVSWLTWELAVTSLMKRKEVFLPVSMPRLDMRMDQRQTLTAFDVVKTYDELQIAQTV